MSETITTNPIQPFLEKKGVFIMDGGLATTLEANGCDLKNDLWSADVLIHNPEAISRVHREFLEAGADCIISSTYQASIKGFMRRGFSFAESRELMALSLQLAISARDDFWDAEIRTRDAQLRSNRLKPVVAVSIGPYGAFLADGSEFTGAYDIVDEELYSFHFERWRLFERTEADLFACETIPSMREVKALVAVASEFPNSWCWLSFTCEDERHLRDGTPLAKAVELSSDLTNIAAVGVNCTAPQHIDGLISIASAITDIPILVYPNSGNTYDVTTREWSNQSAEFDWDTAAGRWQRAGASGIGGCCEIGPDRIAHVRSQLRG